MKNTAIAVVAVLLVVVAVFATTDAALLFGSGRFAGTSVDELQTMCREYAEDPDSPRVVSAAAAVSTRYVSAVVSEVPTRVTSTVESEVISEVTSEGGTSEVASSVSSEVASDTVSSVSSWVANSDRIKAFCKKSKK
jgi:hypothetical protein